MTNVEFLRRFEQGIQANDRASIVALLIETSESLVSDCIHESVNDRWTDQVGKFLDGIHRDGEAVQVFSLHSGISRISVGWFKGRLTVHLAKQSSETAKALWCAEAQNPQTASQAI